MFVLHLLEVRTPEQWYIRPLMAGKIGITNKKPAIGRRIFALLTTRRVILGLALLLAMFGDTWAQSRRQAPRGREGEQLQNQPKQTEQPPTQNQRGTEEAPIIVKVLPTNKSDAEAAEDARERQEKTEIDRKKTELDTNLVNFNGDLAYYTKVLALVAGFQFLALIVQAIILALAFKESRRAGDIARDAMIAGERAFVFATNVQPFWERGQTADAYNWRFRPVWQNSGDTPTRNMKMHVECALRDAGLPLGFNFDYPTAEIGTALIPPKIITRGGIAPQIPRAPISPQDILDVQQGRKILYLWGWARYFDVFPNTPQHITRFCWVILPIGDPLSYVPGQLVNGQETLTFNWILHFEGNCADEECSK